jgi:tape measure domain-containing protein
MPTITTAAAIDSRQALAGARQFNDALASMRGGVAQTASALTRLNGALAFACSGFVGFAVVAAARATIGAADEYTRLKIRLDAVAGSANAGAALLAKLNAEAKAAQVPASVLTGAYADMARALREKGRSENDGIQALGLLAKAMTASGASTDQQRQAVEALSDGFVRGRFNAETFFRLMETAPALMEDLQRATGLSTLQLRKMAELGKISGDTIVSALLNSADRIEARFTAVPQTIGQRFEVMSERIKNNVGKIASPFALGAVHLLDRGIDLLATGVETLGKKQMEGIRAVNAWTDQLRFADDVARNYAGALDRASESASKFASAFGTFRKLAGERASIGPFQTTVTPAPAGAKAAVKFEESEFEKQARVLLQMERDRNALINARAAGDRQAIAA